MSPAESGTAETELITSGPVSSESVLYPMVLLVLLALLNRLPSTMMCALLAFLLAALLPLHS